jgi:hypothetical protein
MGGGSNDGEISRFRFAFLSVDRLANAASSMLATRHTHDSMTMKDASCKCKHVLLLKHCMRATGSDLARECTRFKNWLKGTCFQSADALPGACSRWLAAQDLLQKGSSISKIHVGSCNKTFSLLLGA